MTILLDVDGSGRVNLNRLDSHVDRFKATKHEDGSITLTPAVVLTKDELNFLNDTDLQRMFETAERNADRTRGLNRRHRRKSER